MALEIISAGRLGRRQRARLAEVGWEKPRGREMPYWWHLVGDMQEGRIVAGQLILLLSEVYGIEVADLFELVTESATTAGDEEGLARLAGVANAWNDAARRRGFPECDPDPEEFYDGGFFCIINQWPVEASRISPDLVLVGNVVTLTFRIDPEGSAADPASIAPLLPPEIVIDKDPRSAVVSLTQGLTDIGEDALAQAWGIGVRSAIAAWAIDLPQEPTDWESAEFYGFPDSALFGDTSTLEPLEATLATIIPVAAAYLSTVDPPRATSLRGVSFEGGGVPDFDLLMVLVSLDNGSDELIDIVGTWLEVADLDALRAGHGEATSSDSRLRLLELIPELDLTNGPTGPTWRYRSSASIPPPDDALCSLGWQRTADASAEYELPAGLSVEEAGKIVARTIVEVGGLVIRELTWQLLQIGDPAERLRRFIRAGRL